MLQAGRKGGLTNAAIRLEVEQCDDGTITALFCARFGGRNHVHADANYNGRPVWRWCLSDRKSVALATVVLLRASHNPTKRSFLCMGAHISTLPAGEARAATATDFRDAKLNVHAGGAVDCPENNPGLLPPATIGWIAGFFDGDGSVACIRRNYTVELEVTQAEPYAIHMLSPFLERWGGTIDWHAPKPPKKHVGLWQLRKLASVFVAARELLPESRHPDRRAHLELVCKMLSPPTVVDARPWAAAVGDNADRPPPPKIAKRSPAKCAELQHRRFWWFQLRAYKDTQRARIGKLRWGAPESPTAAVAPICACVAVAAS